MQLAWFSAPAAAKRHRMIVNCLIYRGFGGALDRMVGTSARSCADWTRRGDRSPPRRTIPKVSSRKGYTNRRPRSSIYIHVLLDGVDLNLHWGRDRRYEYHARLPGASR